LVSHSSSFFLSLIVSTYPHRTPFSRALMMNFRRTFCRALNASFLMSQCHGRLRDFLSFRRPFFARQLVFSLLTFIRLACCFHLFALSFHHCFFKTTIFKIGTPSPFRIVSPHVLSPRTPFSRLYSSRLSRWILFYA